MKTVLRAFICTSLVMTSCNTDRKFRDALTAKGCNMNSIRAQSELAFRKMDKRMKIPAGYFTTDIIENDSLILIQRTLTNGDIRNKGGMDVVISKATCKVTKLLVYQ